MSMAPRRHWRNALLAAGLVTGGALLLPARPAAQAPAPFPGMLDEHPRIQYAQRPTTDRVAALNQALADKTRTLAHDARTGYLVSVLEALGNLTAVPGPASGPVIVSNHEFIYVKDAVYHRLGDILTGAVSGPTYTQLSASDRRAIIEILRDTKTGLPAAWGA